jgi:hypothetical protein
VSVLVVATPGTAHASGIGPGFFAAGMTVIFLVGTLLVFGLAFYSERSGASTGGRILGLITRSLIVLIGWTSLTAGGYAVVSGGLAALPCIVAIAAFWYVAWRAWGKTSMPSSSDRAIAKAMKDLDRPTSASRHQGPLP